MWGLRICRKVLPYEYTERDALTPLSDSNVSLVVPKERYDAGDGGS